MRKRISNAISTANSNRDTPVKSVVDVAFCGLSGETLLLMPARNTLRARITRHRNKDIGAVNSGRKSDDWPESIKQTRDGRNFLFYDSGLTFLNFGYFSVIFFFETCSQ